MQCSGVNGDSATIGKEKGSAAIDKVRGSAV